MPEPQVLDEQRRSSLQRSSGADERGSFSSASEGLRSPRPSTDESARLSTSEDEPRDAEVHRDAMFERPSESHVEPRGSEAHRDALSERPSMGTAPAASSRSMGSWITGGIARTGAFLSGNKTAGKHTWERRGQKAMRGLDSPLGEGLQAGLEAAEVHTPLHVAETTKHVGIMLQSGAHGMQKLAGIKSTGIADDTRQKLHEHVNALHEHGDQFRSDLAEIQNKQARAKASGEELSSEAAHSHIRAVGPEIKMKDGTSRPIYPKGRYLLDGIRAHGKALELGKEVKKAGHFSPEETSITDSEAMFGHHAERVYGGKDQHGKEKWLMHGTPGRKALDAPLPDVSPKSTLSGKVNKVLEMPGNLLNHAADVIDGTGGEEDLKKGKFGLAGAKSALGIGGGAAKVVAAHTADAHGAMGLGGLAVSAGANLAAAPVRGTASAYHYLTGTKKRAEAQRNAEKNKHWWGKDGSRQADVLENGISSRPSFDGSNHEAAGVPEDDFAKHGESYSEGAAAARTSLANSGWTPRGISASAGEGFDRGKQWGNDHLNSHNSVAGTLARGAAGMFFGAKAGLSAMASNAVVGVGSALGGMRGAAAGAWSNAKGHSARKATSAKNKLVHGAKSTWAGMKSGANWVGRKLMHASA